MIGDGYVHNSKWKNNDNMSQDRMQYYDFDRNGGFNMYPYNQYDYGQFQPDIQLQVSQLDDRFISYINNNNKHFTTSNNILTVKNKMYLINNN